MNKLLSTASAVAIAGSMMLGLSTAATADQVFNDDVIITFSLCVGNDCVNGESFGFDTIRLKENNLRISFVDTSVSASFPTNDWEIEVNSSNNGGESYFAIDDVSAGRTPFRVQAGAPTGALWVDSAGDIGIGEQTPIVEVHVTDGDTPTIRLEQDGSSGFTAQTYDIAANETNFFIRDVTNGSRLGFRMRPGAPESSIDIAADGDVGVGTSSPQASLHVRRSNGSAGVLIEDVSSTAGAREVLGMVNNGGSWISMANSSSGDTWYLTHENAAAGRFIVDSDAIGGPAMMIEHDGDVVIAGTITTTGSCSGGCDAVFDAEYELPSIEEHAEYMYSNRHLMHVGPTPEEGPFNLSTKVGGMLSELEYAHRYIAELNERITALETERSDLQ